MPGRSAAMTIVSPYPDDSARGVLTGILECLKPTDSLRVRVMLDGTKPRSDDGGDSTTFIVT